MASSSGDDVVWIDDADHVVVVAGDGHDTVKVAESSSFSIVSLHDGNDDLQSWGGATAAWGGSGNDRLAGGPGPDLLDGGYGDDVIAGSGGADQLWGERGDDSLDGGEAADILRGGVGDDLLDGGFGDDLLYGGTNADELVGGPGSDLLEGNAGDDRLAGGEGSDRLLGQDGDDRLEGGPDSDLLIPGAGLDETRGGKGDDLIVLLHACQVQRGEYIDAEAGQDTLLTPLSVAELEALGVEIHGIERVRQFPADGFACDPVTCDCGNYEVAPTAGGDICDYSSAEFGLTPAQRKSAQQACHAMLEAIPKRLEELPAPITTAAAEAVLETSWHDALAPTRIAQFAPHEPSFPPTNPMPNVSTSAMPCDMPDMDIHIDVARGGINNCNGTEKDEVQEALDHAAFMLFRMEQQIDAIVAAEDNPAAAQALWEQSSGDGWGRFALSWWFGAYDAGRAKVVQSTVAELKDIFFLDDDGLLGAKHNVQCYHRLRWWEYIVYGRLNPATIVLKTVGNSCFYEGEAAHAIFALPVFGRAAALSVYYPFESIELCPLVFQQETWDPPERLGGVIMHELLHFHDNAQGRLKDNHGDTADEVCEGSCYEEDEARDLAVAAPNYAVVNIDNYRAWANTTSTLYTNGYCDDSDPGLCFISDCCGDGVLQSDLSETCDDADFGALDCLTEAGYTEGELTCSSDCQIITSEQCHGSCGNGAIDPALHEACDTDDFGGASCASLFGSEMGSLGCSDQCMLETAACDGTFPASYWGCGVEADSACLQSPELCHTTPGSGTCTGGPCVRTDPTNRTAGQSDSDATFHPRGNFRDVDGHLYRCDDGPSGPRTCVDEDGFGVCRECGLAEGQTMVGCPCTSSTDCALDQSCFGGDFPHGGFCWSADEGPPEFQCAQGACGQSFFANDGGSYCEHYSLSGPARCMPETCNDISAQECSEQGLICDENGSQCMSECGWIDDCPQGWPTNFACTPALTCEFQP